MNQKYPRADPFSSANSDRVVGKQKTFSNLNPKKSKKNKEEELPPVAAP